MHRCLEEFQNVHRNILEFFPIVLAVEICKNVQTKDISFIGQRGYCIRSKQNVL